jgi:hypothetical protein
MALYQAPDNSVHDDDDGRALVLASWPKNAIQITQAEADAILNPPMPLAELKADKIADINANFELAIGAIKNGYPSDEIASWSKQEEEARAYVTNGAASTPLLDALATARGITKVDLVNRIIIKADLFAAVSGRLIGKRQALEDRLNAIPLNATAMDVAAIAW